MVNIPLHSHSFADSTDQSRSIRSVCLSGSDPRQSNSGGTVYTNSVLSLIKTADPGIKIELCCPLSSPKSANSARRRVFQAICLARSLISDIPAKSHFVYSKSFDNQVTDLFHTSCYDLVFINADDLLWLLPLIPDQTTKILICHNLEHALFESMMAYERPNTRLVSRLLQRELRKLKSFEISRIKSIRNVIAISKHETDVIRSFHPNVNILHIPPTFSYEISDMKIRNTGTLDLTVGFLGKFTWWPNLEGVKWFIREVLPHLSYRISLHLFGQGSETFHDPAQRVIGHGFVDQIAQVWSICDIMICPVFSGAGVNVKLAESLYNRVPVITTSYGLRSLDLSSHIGLQICDSREQWIEYLNALAEGRTKLPTVHKSVRRSFTQSRYVPLMAEFLAHIADE